MTLLLEDAMEGRPSVARTLPPSRGRYGGQVGGQAKE
jgi:hypothetical protein